MVVKWNVANTDGPLVNCQHVNILLSTDGGYTYPITLLKNTANDGEEGVILPQGLVSSSARIRINPVDNIFFDISNKDFTIRSQSKDAYTVAFNSERQKYCLPDTAILNIQSAALGNYDKTIKLSVTGLPQGAIAKFDSDTLIPNQNTRLVIDLGNVTQQGDIIINLRAIAGTDTIYRSTKIRTVSADFSALAFTTPAEGATAVSPLPSFKWASSPNAELYDFQLATNPSFATGTVIGTFNNLTANELNSPVTLQENKLYFWRIRAKNNCTAGEWLTPAPFHTLVQACNEYKNTKVNNIPASQAISIDSQIDVAESGVISDVNITGIKGTHANFGHLELRLISPSGKVSFLSDKKCAFQGGNALNMRYDDESTLVNKCDKLLSSGTYYRPETPLNVFDGENTKGLWTCQIKDVAAGDGGSITEWAVRFCSSTAVSAPSLIKNDTLRVRPNNGRFISDSLLLATDDKATPQQLTYTLVTLPKSGKLERWAGGTLDVGTTFSQAELNQRNLIRYVNGNNAAKNDFFLFVLTDGEGGFAGTLRYNILIDSKAPLSNVQDPTLAQAVKVYPNPTQNILNVSIYQNTTQLTKLQLFNVSGQQVTEKYLHEGEDSTQIDTSILPEGLYLLKISNSTGFATKRVVVQR
jgi:subtilisin-like proprotein convertase family protein